MRDFTSGTPMGVAGFQPTSRTEKPTGRRLDIQTPERAVLGGVGRLAPHHLHPDFLSGVAAPLGTRPPTAGALGQLLADADRDQLQQAHAPSRRSPK